MSEMTSRERYLRALNHQEADRIPITDSPWGETTARWKREGLPENADLAEYFGWDRSAGYGGDWTLRLPGETIEETDKYIISRSGNGAITKNFKSGANIHHSTTQWLGYTITDRKSWEEYRGRLKPTKARINWDSLKSNREMIDRGILTVVTQPIGFDPNSQIIGQPELLIIQDKLREYQFRLTVPSKQGGGKIMNYVTAKLTILCIALTIICLGAVRAAAKIDSKTIVGIWLMDEAELKSRTPHRIRMMGHSGGMSSGRRESLTMPWSSPAAVRIVSAFPTMTP